MRIEQDEKRFFLKLLVFALICRFVASFTQLSWAHPDEWFQTAEMGNMLAFGFTSWTQEVGYHLRNLTWPAFLGGVMKLSQWIAPGHVGLKAWSVRFLTVVLDFSSLWGVFHIVRTSALSAPWRRFAWGMMILPWFLIQDSTRPSAEHLSMIALWWCLGAVATQRWFWAGVFCALIAVFRYPSALLSFGILLFLLIRPISREAMKKIGAGLLAATLLGGLADWIVYGRPYESFWMYFQYNVYHGLGAKLFGSQGVTEYYSFMAGRWGGFLLPLTVFLCIGLIKGGFDGIRKKEPWAGAMLAYVIGHLLTSHKEPRFIYPAERLLLWGAILGLCDITRIFLPFWTDFHLKRAVKTAGWLLFLVNFGYVLRALWGESWIPSSTFYDINKHLESTASVCAVVTVNRPLSVLLPWRDPAQVPTPAIAYFPSQRHPPQGTELLDLKERPLIWIEKAPQCNENSMVLLHLRKPNALWSWKQGCELLPSGILAWVPHSSWPKIMEKNLSSGPWYRCPAKALQVFEKQEIRPTLARLWPKWETLPGWDLSDAEFRFLGDSKIPAGVRDGTLGDW